MTLEHNLRCSPTIREEGKTQEHNFRPKIKTTYLCMFLGFTCEPWAPLCFFACRHQTAPVSAVTEKKGRTRRIDLFRFACSKNLHHLELSSLSQDSDTVREGLSQSRIARRFSSSNLTSAPSLNISNNFKIERAAKSQTYEHAEVIYVVVPKPLGEATKFPKSPPATQNRR